MTKFNPTTTHTGTTTDIILEGRKGITVTEAHYAHTHRRTLGISYRNTIDNQPVSGIMNIGVTEESDTGHGTIFVNSVVERGMGLTPRAAIKLSKRLMAFEKVPRSARRELTRRITAFLANE